MELTTIELFVILKNLRTAEDALSEAEHQLANHRNQRKRKNRDALLDGVYCAKKELYKAQDDADEIITRVQAQINASAE